MDPSAMFMNRALSALPRRRNPSAMLAGMDTEARRICEDSPYRSEERRVWKWGRWESRKSEVRSQNGGGVRAEEPADFLQACGQLLVVGVANILGEDEKIAALFDGSFCDVHEPSLICFTATTESFGDVGRNGYGGTTHLRGQPVQIGRASCMEMGEMGVEEVRSQKPEWRRCTRRGAC